MKVITCEIAWHNKEPVYSLDLQPGAAGRTHRLASAGVDTVVRVQRAPGAGGGARAGTRSNQPPPSSDLQLRYCAVYPELACIMRPRGSGKKKKAFVLIFQFRFLFIHP